MKPNLLLVYFLFKFFVSNKILFDYKIILSITDLFIFSNSKKENLRFLEITQNKYFINIKLIMVFNEIRLRIVKNVFFFNYIIE